MTSTRTILSLIFSILMVSPALRADALPDSPIFNFHEVSPGIYRGGSPRTDEDKNYLKDVVHVKTIISLQSFRYDMIFSEKHWAKKNGIHFKREPMTAIPYFIGEWLFPVSDDRVDEIMDLMADPDLRPLYVHCFKGEDRTGMVIGLHRVINEHWDPKAAYTEMLQLGFHPKYKAFQDYFFERTGLSEDEDEQ